MLKKWYKMNNYKHEYKSKNRYKQMIGNKSSYI